MAGGYYAAGGGIEEDSVPGLPIATGRGKHRSRNSILSLGGGIMGKAKNMLGMGPEYSEMDLPLTETAAGRPISGPEVGSTPSPARLTRPQSGPHLARGSGLDCPVEASRILRL